MRSVRAGVHSIEHGTFMDEPTARLLKENGTAYVPTMTAMKWMASQTGDEDDMPAEVRAKATGVGPRIDQTVRMAYEKGVWIVFGTDAGVFPHALEDALSWAPKK